ncbi:MAG: helix-turn-helix domain-containing protein [Methanotrichaceae archaeon]
MGSDNQNYSNAKWWETAEGHRFALEVLQLGMRRKILRFIGSGTMTKEEIAKDFGLRDEQAEYHLAPLEKALVIEHTESGYRVTPTGILYLDRVELKR